ncbi:MAG: hypothetical protein ACLQBX_10965 [Candidatus Limnocylindrales bacterium]
MTEETTTLRRCIGSVRFGIEAHEAPLEDFPRQSSQTDGLGRMCHTHWSAYTAGLARDAKKRKATAEGRDAATPTVDQDPAASTEQPTGEPERAGKRGRRATTPEPDRDDVAG